jgi:hypothetical protein
MGLWENKYLKVIFCIPPPILTELYDFRVSKDYLDSISEKLNMLKLKPVSRKMKNKLKTIQYIQFEIIAVPYSTKTFSKHKNIHVGRPKFKKNSDAVIIILTISVIKDEEYFLHNFYHYLYIAIKEGLYSLDMYNCCI